MSSYVAKRSIHSLSDNQTTAPLASNSAHASQCVTHKSRLHRLDIVLSFQSVGHIVEPLKGDADEEEDALQPWMCTPISVMCPRYSTAFGIGQ
ncbi:hypothetical protein SCLCIDRAFT_751289 [Scleroderma citrinum Foug A]|uniref:Uncharacterized protein n=1 Tax=Scleroderma citrinum Foug A TaxID=1036808 RepID=A0A0C2YM52_9AGAM|nr:hypothetical protein SCLCIDRAFT_751289 [Scleroderma citrinum Foug A]